MNQSRGGNVKRRNGFTLIELLLVLAILGIISAIAIPALMSQSHKQHVAKDPYSVQSYPVNQGFGGQPQYTKNEFKDLVGISKATLFGKVGYPDSRVEVDGGTFRLNYSNKSFKSVVIRDDYVIKVEE